MLIRIRVWAERERDCDRVDGRGGEGRERWGNADEEERVKDGSCGGSAGELRDNILPCFAGRLFRFPLDDINRLSVFSFSVSYWQN